MKKILLLIFVVFTLLGCEKLFIAPNPSNTPTENFEILWKTVRDKYCYFELKGIDWQSIYQKYRPKVNDQLTQDAFFTIVSQMMNELHDGHVNLQIPNTRYNYTYYSALGLLRGYARNFNDSILTNQYLKFGYGQKIRSTVLNENIGYIYYGSFSTTLEDKEWDNIINKMVITKGLIIDIRDNNGGSVENIKRLMQHFLLEKTLIGFTRSKNSATLHDFKNYTPVYVEPSGSFYGKKIILLTNRRVFSAANMFASAMSEQPQVTLVGDVTGGGGAGPIGGELPNGWLYRFSAVAFSNTKKEDIENGVMPDYRINITTKDESAKIDTILEKAIELLN
ncbi:MAG: S41 family peptidase [Flectobacillus sp.]|uniref:S41 family peptidase n=1 Tax=Flectobacillus sp. TaxID=50419 RepID=UPI003B9A1A98